jgi:hypothetical protein
MFITAATDFPSSVRNGIRRAPLLTELKTKYSPKTINIALLTELKTTRFGQQLHFQLRIY